MRTLESLAASVRILGATIEFLTPEGFPSMPLPTYPGLRFALPNRAEIARRIEHIAPNSIHIATEGPIGYSVRCYCIAHKLPFTTSFTTRFAEYLAARFPIPISWGYRVLRAFHAPATATMVSTHSLMVELRDRGFEHLNMWTRGVDTELFTPKTVARLNLPRPIFLTVGRIAVEKNLEAFLVLDLPGSKVVIGHGPQEAELRARFPDVHFLGSMSGSNLAAHYAAADVFVFPSCTDTFGVVQLEALSCGVPVAAFPVTGPLDVVGTAPVGVLNDKLEFACIAALAISRTACREHALRYGWETSARQFLANVVAVRQLTSCAGSASHPHRPVGRQIDQHLY